MEDFISNFTLALSLRRRHVLVIGTHQKKLSAFIHSTYNVPVDTPSKVHSNINTSVTEMKVNQLTKSELEEYLKDPNYDEVVFFSTHLNVEAVKKFKFSAKSEKLTFRSYSDPSK